jgi:hypothetical protein
MFILAPNAKAFYDHIEHSMQKVQEELDQDIVQGFFAGLPFMPIQFVENSYVTQKDKERRIGRGNAPYGPEGGGFMWEGKEVSINASIDLDEFPDLTLPTIFTFASNTRIAQTLFDVTGDPRLQQEQVYSDWVSFYRWLVPMLLYWWTSCIIIHPGGILVDGGMFFGCSASPGLANRVMNVLLWFWRVLILLCLDEVTTWDVTANDGNGAACEPGASNMFAHCAYHAAATNGYMPPDLKDWAKELTADIPTVDAAYWDQDPRARQWRQQRYRSALAAGLSMRDAIYNSLPYTASGFFDDSQQSAAACMITIVLGCLLRLTQLTGVKVSGPKLQWAKPGVVGTAKLLQPEPTLVSHLVWTFVAGFAVALGRELNTVTWRLFDTIARIDEANSRLDVLLGHGAGQKNVLHVTEQALQSAAGLFMFMIQVARQYRALMNSTWRCLGRTPFTNGRRFTPRVTVLSLQAQHDLKLLISGLRRRRGYSFAPTSQEPDGRTRPRIFIMNDSAGKSSRVGDTSFRGGGAWLHADHFEETPWCNVPWTDEQLTKHSTETEMANANCSLAAVARAYPHYDIIEVLDNQAAVHTLRRLACDSPSIERQIRYRLEILEVLPTDTRVFTLWSCREQGSLADMLSKDDLDGFRRALAVRGLPPPQATPMERGAPIF